MSPSLHRRSAGLTLIAAFKLLKATVLILIGVGALRLIHRDVEATAIRLVNHFRGDPDNRYIHALLSKITSLSPHRLEALGIGALIYAGLFLTEGIGLLLQKRWAEWLTVVSGSGFIPLEIYEVIHHARWGRITVLVINIAIVAYLVREIRKKTGSPE
jgi:uncharacterized membrane protein (DUF2068 family)